MVVSDPQNVYYFFPVPGDYIENNIKYENMRKYEKKYAEIFILGVAHSWDILFSTRNKFHIPSSKLIHVLLCVYYMNNIHIAILLLYKNRAVDLVIGHMWNYLLKSLIIHEINI